MLYLFLLLLFPSTYLLYCVSRRRGVLKYFQEHISSMEARLDQMPFLIFIEAKTKKSVQLVQNHNQPIVLDLPKEFLNNTEAKRAKEYFACNGGEFSEYDLRDSPEGEVVGKGYSFQMCFNNAVDASIYTLGVYEYVYRLKVPKKFNTQTEVS